MSLSFALSGRRTFVPSLKMKTRTCPNCGKSERGPSRNLTSIYCGKEGLRIHRAGKHLRTGKEIECSECGLTFYVRGSHVNKSAKYCSSGCYSQSRLNTKRCLTCKEEFKSTSAQQSYCSVRCSKLGPLNPKWKPERARTARQVAVAELERWRDEVFRRDEYQCRICGKDKPRLHPHHMDGFHWSVERRFDVNNGVTLCKSCHERFHSRYGTHDNTEAQFNEWATQAKGERQWN